MFPDELSVLSGLATLHGGLKGFFLQSFLSEELGVGERLFDQLCSLPRAKIIARRYQALAFAKR